MCLFVFASRSLLSLSRSYSLVAGLQGFHRNGAYAAHRGAQGGGAGGGEAWNGWEERRAGVSYFFFDPTLQRRAAPRTSFCDPDPLPAGHRNLPHAQPGSLGSLPHGACYGVGRAGDWGAWHTHTPFPVHPSHALVSSRAPKTPARPASARPADANAAPPAFPVRPPARPPAWRRRRAAAREPRAMVGKLGRRGGERVGEKSKTQQWR